MMLPAGLASIFSITGSPLASFSSLASLPANWGWNSITPRSLPWECNT